MKLKIRVTTYGSQGSSFSVIKEFNKDECRIGREESDVVLNQANIESQHAIIYQGLRGELRIRDLSTMEGTYLGNEKIVDRAICEGTVLVIANTAISILRFEVEALSFNGP